MIPKAMTFRISYVQRMFGAIAVCSIWLAAPHRSSLYAQTTDNEIKLYVDKLNKGQTDDVKKALPDLAAKYQSDPGVIYLQGRVASNGIEAVKLYQTVVTNFPKSEWADEALYRIYQYYYAMGLYKTAEAKLRQLKREYPNSPYASVTSAEKFPAQNERKDQTGSKEPADTLVSREERQAPVKSAAPPPKAVPTPVEKQGRYTLQVGAFTTAANAEKQKSFFEKLGYQAEMTNKVRSGRSLFLVWVGSFRTPDEAKAFARRVRSKYNIDSMVVER